MSRRVAIFDTSLFCCWLEVPGRETAGSGTDLWNTERVAFLVESELDKGSMIVLPLATIIETGNHISQAPRLRFETANRLSEQLRKAAQSESPWAAFTEQSILWEPDQLTLLADQWPALAARKISIADATIKHVADYYARAGYAVRILTADTALRHYEPPAPTKKPRRRL
jgi:hypothetical protein